jgi:type 1 fimbria pilin
MKWSISSLLMSAAVVGMLCIPRVAAAGGSLGAASGRITFTGAITAPTCEVKTENVAPSFVSTSEQSFSRRIDCSGSHEAVVAQQVVVRLTDGESDHVLKYFNDYVKASQVSASRPLLVTQTYE